MSAKAPNSDRDVLDLLQSRGPLGVSELTHAMEVTNTSVRQRLLRLMAKEMIQRETVRHGRGRPRHLYALTEKGEQFLSAAVRGAGETNPQPRNRSNER